MRFIRLPLLALFLLVSLSLPMAAYAQGTSSIFDPIIPDECKCTQVDVQNVDGTATSVKSPSAPSWGCVLKVVQNVINTAVGIAVIVVVLAIVYAGFILMTSGANPQARTQGRNLVTNAVVGLLVLLGAWIGVDFVMKIVYNPTAVISGDTVLGPWNAIWSSNGNDMCLVVRQPMPIATGVVDLIHGVLTGTQTSPGGGGGSCVVPTVQSHPCSIQSLSGTCFAASGTGASMVCNKESGGRSVPSSSDKLNGGSGPPYSWGLWQINLTTTDTRAAGWGMDCRAAFDGPCSGRALLGRGRCSRRVTNPELYARCTAAALDPAKNTRAACNLYTPNLGAWACSAQRCQVPGARNVNDPACRPGS